MQEKSKNPAASTGTIAKFSRKIPASDSVLSLNLIKNTFRDAVEYKGIADGTRGIFLFLGTVCAGLIFYSIADTLKLVLNRPDDFGTHLISSAYACVAIPFGIYFFIKNFRQELFRPEDEPIIFDRKDRKVYRIFREVIPGWKGLFKRWPLKEKVYSWDLISAEHHAAVVANNSNIGRLHALVFIVFRNATDISIEDSFTIGSGQLGEVTVPPVYEHIRKFMEEHGPHIPTSEIMSPTVSPSTIWECLASVGPYGENFKTLWNNHKLWLAIIIIFYPILFFIMTPVGIFSWMSYRTATPIKWSEDVIAATGRPQQLHKPL